jgi:ATP synthase F1 complex assembly factor 1
MEHLEKNPYYAKYADRVKKLQQTSPAEFQAKLDALEAAKQAERSQREADLREAETEAAAAARERASRLGLDAIMDVDRIREKTPEEITEFLYLLPRNEGYEYFVQRWSGDACHFTPLIAFQTHRENAQTCLTLTHYTELLEDRGIVLMNGQLDAKVLSIYEAQLLALQVKLYYGICAGLKFNHVRHFNNSPQTFHHEQLIREFENYKKDARDKKEGTF